MPSILAALLSLPNFRAAALNTCVFKLHIISGGKQKSHSTSDYIQCRVIADSCVILTESQLKSPPAPQHPTQDSLPRVGLRQFILKMIARPKKVSNVTPRTFTVDLMRCGHFPYRPRSSSILSSRGSNSLLTQLTRYSPFLDGNPVLEILL